MNLGGPWPGPSRWARLLRALGFQQRFWWTMPVPFHPWIALLLPFVPLALVVWQVFAQLTGNGAASGLVLGLLGVGLALIIPLSVPILNIFLMIFRIPLLQGMCFLSAMLVLLVELAGGVRPLIHGLPALLYFGFYAVQRCLGPAKLMRLQEANAAFLPIDADDAVVAVTNASRPDLLQDLSGSTSTRIAASVRLSQNRGWQFWARLDEGAEQWLAQQLPEAFRKEGYGGVVIREEGVDRIKPEITIDLRTVRDLRLYGRMRRMIITDRDQTRRTFTGGTVAVVGNWPFLMIFYDMAVFSGSSSNARWIIGFPPRQEVDLGPKWDHNLLEHALATPERPHRLSAERLSRLLAPLADRFAFRRADEDRRRADQLEKCNWLLDKFLESGTVLMRAMGPHSFFNDSVNLRGRGSALCAALMRAKEQRDTVAVELASRLLQIIPINEFVGLDEVLRTLLPSRILALRWRLTPDVDVSLLPRGCPRWGNDAGFGLMDRFPELWARMGDLSPWYARVVAGFIKEVGERPALVEARRRFAERGIALPAI